MKKIIITVGLLCATGCIEGDYALYSLHDPEIVEVPVEVLVPVEVPVPVEVLVEVPGEGGRFGSTRSNNRIRWMVLISFGLSI